MDPRLTERSLTTLMAEALVRRVVPLLEREQISVLILKGVLWQRTLYARPEDRPIRDVDVLVPEGCFERAAAILLRDGFRVRLTPGPHECALFDDALPLELDLHRLLFARHRYRLSVQGVFARATRDAELFDGAVLVPHPLDQLAHLVGHFANDHIPSSGMYAQDFARLIRKGQIGPEAAARHLFAHGLARAARFSLPELASAESASFARDCLQALPRDRLGDGIGQGARFTVHRTGPTSLSSKVASHALNTSLSDAVKSAASAGIYRVESRLKNRGSWPS